MSFVSSAAIVLSLIGSSAAFQVLIVPMKETRLAALCSPSSSDNYLSSLSGSLSGGRMPTIEPPKPPPTEIIDQGHQEKKSAISFSHAPISYFALDKLTPKGPRKNADVGQPHDATRPLVTVGSTSAGSWWCATGGWPSLTPRTTTEVFMVLSGHGCLTDLDGMRHYFGPGDTVILPKGWSGRWDVLEDIHKVWFVYDHPWVEETSDPIRAVITHYSSLSTQNMSPQTERTDAIHGSPSTASSVIYSVGPTEVGCWICTPGSFPVTNRATTECFHVLEGVFFLTNTDGVARRCVVGDTVVLPKGWTGKWDVIETVKKLWVVVE